MAKPPWRENDDNPKRGDDIRVRAFGVEVEASGRVVILTLIALAALGGVVAHAFVNTREHDAMLQAIEQQTRAIELQTCVLTLNEGERREFRTEGKYCGGFRRPRVSFRHEAEPQAVWRGLEAQAKEPLN